MMLDVKPDPLESSRFTPAALSICSRAASSFACERCPAGTRGAGHGGTSAVTVASGEGLGGADDVADGPEVWAMGPTGPAPDPSPKRVRVKAPTATTAATALI